MSGVPHTLFPSVLVVLVVLPSRLIPAYRAAMAELPISRRCLPQEAEAEAEAAMPRHQWLVAMAALVVVVVDAAQSLEAPPRPLEVADGMVGLRLPVTLAALLLVVAVAALVAQAQAETQITRSQVQGKVGQASSRRSLA